MGLLYYYYYYYAIVYVEEHWALLQDEQISVVITFSITNFEPSRAV